MIKIKSALGGGNLSDRHLKEIRALPLFASTNDASFAALTRGAYVQNFPPHTELITEGDSADFLHILSSGCVELFSTWAEHETTMAHLRTHSTFILAATIKDRPYLMSARTIEKSRIIMIPSMDIRAVFDGDPEFAKSIVTELASCYRGAIRNTKNLKLRTSLERLANYLLRHDKGGTVTLDVEKKRLASYLGMTAENLSRAFASLKDYDVEVDGQIVTLGNRRKLVEFARPDPLIDD